MPDDRFGAAAPDGSFGAAMPEDNFGAEMPEGSFAARFQLRGRGIRQHIARGTLVNGAWLLGVNGLSFLKAFAVAAFLTRGEYGVWGLLILTLGPLLWLKDVGIADKYIQQSDEDQELAFQRAFTFELIVTATLTVVLLAAVGALRLVTGRAEIVLPGIVLAVTFGSVFLQAPLWTLYRRMDFVRLRTMQAVDPVVGAVVTLALAIAGAGYWSLVLGLTAGTLATAALAVRTSTYPLTIRFDREVARSYLSFSWPLLAAAATSTVLPIGAVVVGEHAVGLAGVGAITLAVSISQFADRVDRIMTMTLYPAICAVADRTGLLLETFVKSNRIGLIWGVPFGVGLTLFIPDVVEYGIGARWEPAVGLIQVLGLVAAVNHVGFNWDAYFKARGTTRPIAVMAVVSTVTFCTVVIPLLLSDGLRGFGIGIAIMTAVTIGLRTWFLARLFGDFSMIGQALRAATPTVPAVLAVLAARALEGGERALWMPLAEVALYLAVTVVATLVFERELLREIAGYLRRATARPIGTPA